MITVRMTRNDHMFTAALFGSLLLYFMHGALVADLYLPSRHGEGVHLHGAAAWLVTGSPVAFYVALLIRSGFFSFRWAGLQGIVELLLLATGIALIVGGVHLQSNRKVTTSLRVQKSIINQASSAQLNSLRSSMSFASVTSLTVGSTRTRTNLA